MKTKVLSIGLFWALTAIAQPPAHLNYKYMGGMTPDKKLVSGDFRSVHEYMRSLGWDYSEHPNISSADHNEGIHCSVVYDAEIGQYAYDFMVHAGQDIDYDRGRAGSDRQRNEMKTQTSRNWSHLNGNWDEWQRLEWKFRLPKGFQPTARFCHIHQLKAQEGNNGAPLITISTRCDDDGSNKRVQVIHTGDNLESSRGILIDNIPLSDFEDEWIQVETEMHYTHNGTFRVKMTRISDGKILADATFNDVDLWRKGATNIRNKFGIYRSLGRKMTNPSDRPDLNMKDESIRLADFKVYEAATNPNPQPHL